jgi:glucosylceramidase
MAGSANRCPQFENVSGFTSSPSTAKPISPAAKRAPRWICPWKISADPTPGANDYSEIWYSHNETAGDLAMADFSIERDHRYLIPFIEAAREMRGEELTLFASPWSPPTWMKFPQAHNYGTLVWQPEYRKAYADYFVRFVQAYSDVGIPIDAVHVQNEPNSDQKFPSCIWTGAKMRDFIRDDLGPAFSAAGLKTEIWAGTIERGEFNAWAGTIFSDAEAVTYITGAGFQWAGKHAVQRTRQAFPDLPIIQTENECGDGANTWDHAHHVFDLIQHYVSNGTEAYVYWNMVLEPQGESTWGWQQNSMITIDPEKLAVIYNPEFYVMKHFSAFVRPGAQVLATVGPMAANALAFRNLDGTHVFVIQNPSDAPRSVPLSLGEETATFTLPARSINTIRF